MPELAILTEQLLAPVPGGTGRYTRGLAEAMARTAPDGWSVSGVVARHTDVSAARLPGVAGPYPLRLSRRALAAAWRRGLRLWPRADVLHAPTPLAPPSPPRGRALVVTVHDTVPWTHPETLTPHGARWHRAVITRALTAASAIVVPTETVARELRQYAEVTVPIRVIGHGVTAPPDTASEVALPERYVLAVGTVEPRKGLGTLVEAMGRPEMGSVPLVVAGKQGWGGLELDTVAREHGLAPERIVLLGDCSDAVLGAALRGASVLAAPSLAEGFGLPLLEAMAAGVPVVHSDAPALVEVAGGAGIATPRRSPAALAAALRRVLDDTGLAAGLRARGTARAARFTWEEAARETWRLHLDRFDAANSTIRPRRRRDR